MNFQRWKTAIVGAVCLTVFGSFVLALNGCRANRAALNPRDLSPQKNATRAMEAYDTDGDGLLDRQECSPGFAALMRSADKNADQMMTVDEIADRLEFHDSQQVALMSVTVQIKSRRQPVSGNEIRLIPDPVFQNLSSATGITDENGLVDFTVPGQKLPGVRPGLYSVEMTVAGKTKTAKKGIEVGGDMESLLTIRF